MTTADNQHSDRGPKSTHGAAPPPPVRLPFALLAGCFFLSGATALIYELVWVRRLELVFGSTSYSVTTVLAAFMAGLGLGGFLVGRRIRSRLIGLRTYALLEFGIAGFALLSLPLIGLVESGFVAIQSSLQLEQFGATLLKFALAFPLLVLPAGMMGATLPALVRGTISERGELHRYLGRLYGINTVGAAVGTLVAGTLLVEFLGLWRTVILSAGVNACVGVVAWRIYRASREGTAATEDPRPPRTSIRRHLRSRAARFSCLTVGLCGYLSISYEVVWTRLLSLTMGSTTYAFTIVLTIFLIGLGLGSLALSRSARRRTPTEAGLAIVLVVLCLWALLTLRLIPLLPQVLIALAQGGEITFASTVGFELVLAATLLLVPTLCFGAALPWAIGLVSRGLSEVGGDVGWLYLVNTVCAILGSVLTGFLLIPGLGTQNTLVLAFGLNVALAAAGVWLFAPVRLRRLALVLVAVMIAAAVIQPRWPGIVFDSGLGFRLDQVQAESAERREGLLHRYPLRPLMRREGINATISVVETRFGVTMLLNGKPDASTGGDMTTQVVTGALPMLMHKAPRKVNVIGWGSGVTGHVTRLFPGVSRVDVVEIERAVVDANSHFAAANGDVLKDRRVTAYYDDARSHLHTSEQLYDVIISEPSNPWMVGVSNLFSRDFYRLVHRRLNAGGVFGQWLGLYRLEPRELRQIFSTLLSEFKHVQIWLADESNLMLLAARRPLHLPLRRVRRIYAAAPALARLMGAYGPGQRPGDLYGCYIGDQTALERFLGTKRPPPLTDDRPTLEFRATRHIYGLKHHHLLNLLEHKFKHADFLPPGVESTGSTQAQAIAALLRTIRAFRDLYLKVSAWSLKHPKEHPSWWLARARVLLAAKRYDETIATLGYNDTAAPIRGFSGRWRGEALVLIGRALHKQGRLREAAATYAKVEQPDVERDFYLVQTQTALKRYRRGWRTVERLLARFDRPPSVATLRLGHHGVYRRIRELAQRTGDYARVIKLMQGRQVDVGQGRVDYLELMVEALASTKAYTEAAQLLDERKTFGPLGLTELNSCIEVYRNVKRLEQAAACKARMIKLLQ